MLLPAALLAALPPVEDLDVLLRRRRVEELTRIALEEPARFDALEHPLVEVAAAGMLPVVEALLDAGHDPSASRVFRSYFTDYPESALSAAYGSGHRDVVFLLLERGATPEAFGRFRPKSPLPVLCLAAVRRDVEMVERLVARGACPVVRHDGRTYSALSWACWELSHPPIADVAVLELATGHLGEQVGAVGVDPAAHVGPVLLDDPGR